MPKQTLLLYTPPEPTTPWAAKVRQICAIRGFRLRPVEEVDLDRTIGVLLSGHRATELPDFVKPLPEAVMVFDGLSRTQLDHFLGSLIKGGVPKSCLKAVVTAQNVEWTFRTLYEELAREHAAMPGTPFVRAGNA